jgi:hypothetical protein
VAVLRRTVAFYRSLGVEVERVMTDNGAAYRSTAHAVAGYSAFATSVGDVPAVYQREGRCGSSARC